MQRRYPPSDNIVDMRVNPAAPIGSRVRRMIHQDKRWLDELGLGHIIDEARRLEQGLDPNKVAPIPARRYSPLTPEITQAAHDLFNEGNTQGTMVVLPPERWWYPSGR